MITIALTIVSIFTASFCMIIFFDYAVAQVDKNTLESVVGDTKSLNQVPQIGVDGIPYYIFADYTDDNIYVANRVINRNGSVSVVDPTNNVVKNIPVGKDPSYIYGELIYSPRIYIANSGSGSVSVIDTTNNTVVDEIPVGLDSYPSYIYGNSVSPFIYVANFNKSSVSVINLTSNSVVEEIGVGIGPTFIFGASNYSPFIYVANHGSGSVSVIDTTNHIVVDEIHLGHGSDSHPSYIYGIPPLIYVVEDGGGTLSIIDTTNNTNTVSVIDTTSNDNRTFASTWQMTNVKPNHIHYVDRLIYMANYDSGSVSVIDTTNNSLVDEIPVGAQPISVYGGPRPEYIYVTYSGGNNISIHFLDTYDPFATNNITVGYASTPFHHVEYGDAIYVGSLSDSGGGVSVINGMTNGVVVGVMFDTSPSMSGDIICETPSLGDLVAPVNRFLYLSSGAECLAKPNKGFEFTSWRQSLAGNSTRMINASSGSPWTPLFDLFNIRLDDLATSSAFTRFLEYANIRPDNPAATLTVDRFGNFTAYFRALPPPVPPEYWTSLFGIIATALVGSLLIPAVVGWIKSRRQISRLKSFHDQMERICEDKRLDENDIPILNSLNKDLSSSYAAGKINNEQYTNLKYEISIAYEEIFNSSIANRVDDLNRTQEKISDAYSKGKITKLHYDLLNEKVSNMTQEKE